MAAWEQFQQIFKDMKVGTDVVDLQSASSIPDYHAYETVVVLLSDVSPLKRILWNCVIGCQRVGMYFLP